MRLPDSRNVQKNKAGTTKQEAIRELNDEFRRTFIGGRVRVTVGVLALGAEAVQAIAFQVRGYSDFGSDNDPHGEHDFGSFEHTGTRIFFKIDYYDQSLEYGSPDPSDAALTARVLTIMLASEY